MDADIIDRSFLRSLNRDPVPMPSMYDEGRMQKKGSAVARRGPPSILRPSSMTVLVVEAEVSRHRASVG